MRPLPRRDEARPEPGRKTRRCPSDLTGAAWARIGPLLPEPSRPGRKPAVDLREVLNAIRHMAGGAGGWWMRPVHFGPWQTVCWWFRRFVGRQLLRPIHDVALMLDRAAAGREPSPTGGVRDSQTVKARFAEARGRDGGERIVGRKRHLAVDRDGPLPMVNLARAVMKHLAARAVLARMGALARRATEVPELRARLTNIMGIELRSEGPAVFGPFIDRPIETWARVVRENDIRPD